MPVAPAHFQDALDRLRAAAPDYFGGRAIRLEPVEERHGRYGRVLRVAVETPERRLGIFLKRYTPRNDSPKEIARQHACLATEFERTRQAQAAFAATPAVGVARPVARFDDLLTLVTEEAPGEGFDLLLKRLAIRRTRGAREAVLTALSRVGAWLRIFQAGVAANPSTQKDYRRYLAVRLRDLHRAGGIDDAARDAALATFDRLAALVTPGDLAPVAAHADLCPPNILVARDRVTVLDLAMSVDRAKHMDVAFLYMHLAFAGRRLYLGDRLVREMQETLLRSFDPALDSDAPPFRLMLLLQVIAEQCSHIAHHPGGLGGALHHWRVRRDRPWALALAMSQ